MAILARDRFFPRQFITWATGWSIRTGSSPLRSRRVLAGFSTRNVLSLSTVLIGVFNRASRCQAGMFGTGCDAAIAAGAEGAGQRFGADRNVSSSRFSSSRRSFLAGAWVVTVAIPILVLAFLRCERHTERWSGDSAPVLPRSRLRRRRPTRLSSTSSPPTQLFARGSRTRGRSRVIASTRFTHRGRGLIRAFALASVS